MISMNWSFDKYCKKRRQPTCKMPCNQSFNNRPGCCQCKIKKTPLSFYKKKTKNVNMNGIRCKTKPWHCKRPRNVCTVRLQNKVKDNRIPSSWDTVERWYVENQNDFPMKKYSSSGSLNSLTVSIFDMINQVPLDYMSPAPHRALSLNSYSDLYRTGNEIENIPSYFEGTASSDSYDRCYCRYCLNLTPTQPVHCRYYKPIMPQHQPQNYQIYNDHFYNDHFRNIHHQMTNPQQIVFPQHTTQNWQNQPPGDLNKMQNFFNPLINNPTNRTNEMIGNNTFYATNNFQENLAMKNYTGSNNNRNYPCSPLGLNYSVPQNHPNCLNKGNSQFVPPYMNTNENGMCSPNNLTPDVYQNWQNNVNPNFAIANKNALPNGYCQDIKCNQPATNETSVMGQNWQTRNLNDTVNQNKQLNQPKVASLEPTNKNKISENKETRRVIVQRGSHYSGPIRDIFEKKTRNETSPSYSNYIKTKHNESVCSDNDSSDETDATNSEELSDISDGNSQRSDHQLDVREGESEDIDVTSNLSKLSLLRKLRKQCGGKKMLKLKIVKLPKCEGNGNVNDKPKIKLIMR